MRFIEEVVIQTLITFEGLAARAALHIHLSAATRCPRPQAHTGATAAGFRKEFDVRVFQRPHKHRECALSGDLTAGLAICQLKPFDCCDPDTGFIGQLALRHPDERTRGAELTGLDHDLFLMPWR